MSSTHPQPSSDRETSVDVPDTGAVVVTAAGLIGRGTPLEWYECVAVVAGLCSVLGDDVSTCPSPAEVVLSPDGAVVITGRSESRDRVAVPRLLHELLARSAPPKPLRLLVLNAIASGRYASPAAFGEVLAFYERPGREWSIRAARQRFFDPLPPARAVMPEPEDEPVNHEIPVAPVAPGAIHPGRSRAVALALVAVVAVPLAAISGHTRPAGSSPVAGRMQGVMAGLGEGARDLAHQLASHIGFDTQQARADVAPAEAAADEPSSRTTRDRARQSQGGATDAPRNSLTWPSEISTSAPAGPVVPMAGAEGLVDSPWRVATEEPLTSGADDAPARGGIDHDNGGQPDRVVIGPTIPPQLIDPIRLPSWAQPAGTRAMNVIELDITAKGAVERVRFLSPPERMTDMMILSAAKTWIFEPASEGGRPVPYRLTLNWVPPTH